MLEFGVLFKDSNPIFGITKSNGYYIRFKNVFIIPGTPFPMRNAKSDGLEMLRREVFILVYFSIGHLDVKLHLRVPLRPPDDVADFGLLTAGI